jgi:hypothetical protein
LVVAVVVVGKWVVAVVPVVLLNFLRLQSPLKRY